MKTRSTENRWQREGGWFAGRYSSGASSRFDVGRSNVHVKIWEEGRVSSVTLTTESLNSHYGIPVLRVKDPAYQDSVDLGPSEFAPCRDDAPPETAAELLVQIHAQRPLTGKALDAARRFLSQWPEGPQLTEDTAIRARPNTSRRVQKELTAVV